MNLYNMSKEERQECGLAGYKWVTSEEAGFTGQQMSKRIIKNLELLFQTWTPKPHFEIINVNKVQEDKLPHKLLY